MRFTSFDTLLAGGNWNDSTHCSSRCRNANNSRANANANISGQGRIRAVKVFPTPRLNARPCRESGKTREGVGIPLVGFPKAGFPIYEVRI